MSNQPNLTKFRGAIFWDTTIENIDFTAHRGYVINRIFERGNEEEIMEIIRFYGIETIKSEIRLDSKSPFERKIRDNLEKYIY